MHLARYILSAGAALFLALSAHAQATGELEVFEPSCIVVRFSGVHRCGRTAVHTRKTLNNTIGMLTADRVPCGSEAAEIHTAYSSQPQSSIPLQTPVNRHSRLVSEYSCLRTASCDLIPGRNPTSSHTIGCILRDDTP